MSLSKALLAGVALLVLSAPAYATDAPATGVGAASDAATIPGAPSITANTGAGPSNTLPVENINDPVADEAPDAPTSLDASPVDSTATSTDPLAAPTSDSTIAPTEPPAAMDAAPVEPETPTVDEHSAAPETTPAEPEPAPVVEKPKPKVAPPAKLSALSKKYKLMELDTDGNKSLSKAEFTANGFANAKLFAAYDTDHNGKLTNSEINAYAARIESSINK